MSISADFDFKDILGIALGNIRPDGITEAQEVIINDRLGRRINIASISSLTTGIDLEGVRTCLQIDGLKYSVLYVGLEDDGFVRFSMESSGPAKNVTRGMSELITKIRQFKGSSWKEAMCVARPWKSRLIATLRLLVLLMPLKGSKIF